jgi:cysteine-rich repeat protein
MKRHPSLHVLAAISLAAAIGACSANDAGTSSSGATPTCGDGVVDEGETCDDGNQDDGDGCSATCASEGQGGAGGAGGSGGMGGDGGATGGAGGSGGDGGAGGATTIACAHTVMIVAPTEDTFVPAGGMLSAAANVTDPAMGALDALTVRWEDDNGNELGVSSVDAVGFSSTNLALAGTVGNVHARVITPQGACDMTTGRRVYVCGQSIEEDFNAAINPALWTVYGDASWNAAGWLDMTNLTQNQHGAMFNDNDVVTSGNASVRFKVFTGGSNPGADGFALTIIETQQAGDLANLVAAAQDGGGLGYAVGGAYGSFAGAAFTVEIDTWFNQFNGGTELHTDPVMGDHLEITQGGDPGNSLVHTTLPNVQDQQWHDIRVDIVGTRVRVYYDSQLAIDVTEPTLSFKGGRIFFSGSTGFYYNFHRFDDLAIHHGCF